MITRWLRNRPRSLFDAPAAASDRYMSRDACEALYHHVLELTSGGGETSMSLDSTWTGNLRWAGNRIISSGDTRNHAMLILRSIRGAQGGAYTNRLDETGLRDAVALAERRVLMSKENPDHGPMDPPQQYAQPKLFFDSSYNLDAASRSGVGRRLVEPAIDAALMAAGYIETSAHARAVMNTSDLAAYYAITSAQYSVTVRNAKGTGSGWAGVDGNDWAKIDAEGISKRALEKCKASENPRAVEPGRYTVVLEPQAVHDLMFLAIRALDRWMAEHFVTVYTREDRTGSKIGLKLFDERVTISTDPSDPECGYMPFDFGGAPYQPTTWFKDGVLRELAYNRGYAIGTLGLSVARPNPLAYRMSGGDATIEQMIASTERGLLVTRFSDIHVLDQETLMSTGVTRDGLWLIERGKVTYPVKNFRFNESPMFVFNSIEMLGTPQRVFGGAAPAAVVPPVKARDFNFTSMADAV